MKQYLGARRLATRFRVEDVACSTLKLIKLTQVGRLREACNRFACEAPEWRKETCCPGALASPCVIAGLLAQGSLLPGRLPGNRRAQGDLLPLRARAAAFYCLPSHALASLYFFPPLVFFTFAAMSCQHV